MNDRLAALQASAARLHDLVEPLTPDRLDEAAYPTKWTIAQVLSHLGSGAVIMERRLSDSLAGVETPADFAPSVWDEWNAKPPVSQAADALMADRTLVERLASVGADERERSRFAIGPMTLDFDGFVGLRLNEHALHTWDIEVVLDPHATVAPDATSVVIDNLEMIARFSGKPSGVEHTLHAQTTDPQRRFTITLGEDASSLTSGDDSQAPDIELPSEAFIRLIYGRLDPAHTPPSDGTEHLDELRRAFPGI